MSESKILLIVRYCVESFTKHKNLKESCTQEIIVFRGKCPRKISFLGNFTPQKTSRLAFPYVLFWKAWFWWRSLLKRKQFLKQFFLRRFRFWMSLLTTRQFLKQGVSTCQILSQLFYDSLESEAAFLQRVMSEPKILLIVRYCVESFTKHKILKEGCTQVIKKFSGENFPQKVSFLVNFTPQKCQGWHFRTFLESMSLKKTFVEKKTIFGTIFMGRFSFCISFLTTRQFLKEGV